MQGFSMLRQSVCEHISICGAVQEKVITEEIPKFTSMIFL